MGGDRLQHPRGAITIRLLILAAALVTWGPAFTHTDLLLQIEQLDSQIALDPHNAELLAWRGDLYRRHQDYSRAADDFRAARAADPDYALLDFLESRLLLETGKPGEASRYIARYLALDPGNASAWVLSGRAHISLGLAEQAAHDFSRAIYNSDSPTPELYRLLILSLAAQGDEGASAALQSVDEGLERFAGEVNLLGLGTDIALANARLADAVRYIENLPDRLQRLPQWQARLDRANCMQEGDEPDRSTCLDSARAELARQIEAFLGESGPPHP